MSMQTGSIDADGLARTTDGKLYVTLASGTTPVLAGDGTKAAPSYSFASDPDTGPYWRTANVYTVAAGGIEVLQAGSAGIVMDGAISFAASGTDLSLAGGDTNLLRVSANGLRFGASTATTTSRTELNSPIASIADAVATAALTVTIPNAAHSASLRVRVTGSLGAGGAIGANEATATNEYIISITRTAGVNATAAISAAFGAAATAVAGAATVTCTAALSAISGAVGATNTFTVNVTITRSGGSSTNHTCLVYAQLMNANATGITIA